MLWGTRVFGKGSIGTGRFGDVHNMPHLRGRVITHFDAARPGLLVTFATIWQRRYDPVITRLGGVYPSSQLINRRAWLITPAAVFRLSRAQLLAAGPLDLCDQGGAKTTLLPHYSLKPSKIGSLRLLFRVKPRVKIKVSIP